MTLGVYITARKERAAIREGGLQVTNFILLILSVRCWDPSL